VKAKKVDLFAEFGLKDPLGSTSTSASSKNSNSFRICACGSPDPVHKGYCEKCVEKFKTKFERLLEKFNQVKKEYDEYNSNDLSKADEKMNILKHKMA